MSTLDYQLEMDLKRDIAAATSLRAFHRLWESVEQSALSPDKKEFYKNQIAAAVELARENRPTKLNSQIIPCGA